MFITNSGYGMTSEDGDLKINTKYSANTVKIANKGLNLLRKGSNEDLFRSHLFFPIRGYLGELFR